MKKLLLGLALLCVGVIQAQDSLIMHLPFNGNLRDYTGNGNSAMSATSSYSVTFGTDRFSNTNSTAPKKQKVFIRDIYNPFDNGTALDTFSLSVWFKLPSMSNQNTILLDKALSVHYSKDSYGGNNLLVTVGNHLITYAMLPQAAWQHLVIVYTGINTKIYLNNFLVVNQTYPSNNGSGLGKWLNINSSLTTNGCATCNLVEVSNRNYYSGIDDLKLYAKALTASEVAILYVAPDSTYSYGYAFAEVDTVQVFDTTNVTAIDTLVVPIYDTLTTLDTTDVYVTIFDTLTTLDTTDIFVTIYDTTVTNVFDTVGIIVPIYDTLITLDTINITLYDTNTTNVFDTITINDTTCVIIFDTTIITTYDTVTAYNIIDTIIYDSVIIYDTVTFYDTVIVSSVNEIKQTLGYTYIDGILQSWDNSIAVYDLTGKFLFRDQDEVDMSWFPKSYYIIVITKSNSNPLGSQSFKVHNF